MLQIVANGKECSVWNKVANEPIVIIIVRQIGLAGLLVYSSLFIQQVQFVVFFILARLLFVLDVSHR